ncbi:MAG: hypothetical protein RBG13Loki_2042 [Promethearchaeota archaeon CR_4]|nr:MAG: hypothetical protein RBG13Loki_2042 [Candidatus Lokiarchaeota archaeon CR_4]
MLRQTKHGYYQLTFAHPSAGMAKLFAFFERNKILPSDINVEEMSLEDVFIQLVQKGGTQCE